VLKFNTFKQLGGLSSDKRREWNHWYRQLMSELSKSTEEEYVCSLA
jgi:hypothetical protein